MQFQQLMRDKVAFVKKDGSRKENVAASVQSGQVITFDMSIDIEDGDVIERVLPNGRLERYVIVDTGYQPGLHSIPASYQIKVSKESALMESNRSSSVVYNLHGPNAKINIIEIYLTS